MNKLTVIIIVFIMIICSGCDNKRINRLNESIMVSDSTKQYGYNTNFLKKHTEIVEIKNGNAAIALAPAWQGRVMTSTAEGESGFSFGWINHELISSGKLLPHINAFGGEERFWLGPEGGQYSIFFSKGASFVFENWQTPAFIDTTPYNLQSRTDSSALFTCDATAVNYSGTSFDLKVEREVILLSDEEITKQTGIDLNGLNRVAYSSDNKIINTGKNKWSRNSGLLSIWMLGMFNPSPSVVVVIPVKDGDEKIIGPKVNDNYFGKISEERLKVSGNQIFFRADGKSRGKIGIPPMRSTGKMGSWDAENKILTLLLCTQPEGKNEYVNSSWQIQEDPYSGDALNSYNDGPLEDGSQMGPFYELETSSPAIELNPGESLNHKQLTIHLTGNPDDLDRVSRQVLGAGLTEISTIF